MWSSAVGSPVFDPGNVEEYAVVRAAAPFLDLAHDATRHVIARQQLRRPAGLGVALGIAPALFLVVRRLVTVQFRDVVEHEAPALPVAQHAALAAHTLGDQDTAHARRPHHAGGMKLHELHVHQVRAGVVGQGMPVAGVFPAVAGDLVGAAHAAGAQHDRLGAKHPEAPALSVIAKGADHPPRRP